MQFKIDGLIHGPELDAFRSLWTEYTEAENRYLSKDGEWRGTSSAQQFVIDLFTGNDEPYRTDSEFGGVHPAVLATVLPAQMELESLLRARSRALAEMLGRPR